MVWYVDEDEAKRSNDYICNNLEKAALRACACSEHIHMVSLESCGCDANCCCELLLPTVAASCCCELLLRAVVVSHLLALQELDNYVAVSEESMRQYTRRSAAAGRLPASSPKSLKLRLHMGIGVGEMTAVHVGGVFKVRRLCASRLRFCF